MRKTIRFSMVCLLLAVASPLWAQVPTLAYTPAPIPPTPTQVPIDDGCVTSGADQDNLLRNGEFQFLLQTSVGQMPWGWQGTADLIADSTTYQSESSLRGIVMLPPGGSISQIPQTEIKYTRFRISLCALVVYGRLRVKVGETTVLTIPQIGDAFGSGTSGKYQSNPFPADLSIEQKRNYRVTISFTPTEGREAEAIAFIDNVQMLPVSKGDETPEPTVLFTPTIEPSATPVGTITPSPTPTLEAGAQTPTPTAKVDSNTVRLVANPPMITVSPDDFADLPRGSRQQVELDMQFVGSNGVLLDILSIDQDATVTFEIQNQGELQGIGTLNIPTQGESFDNISSRQIKLEDLTGKPIYFYPAKPFTGTVFIIVTLEYETDIAGNREKVEIQGIVPIYIRQSSHSSFTTSTGGFNAQQNYQAGRKPGDRGFRPDLRTNLLFREKISSN